jgi:sigma-B regulation protein RsbU (phosphoserine phosphatase)
MFVTLFYGTLSEKDGTLTYVNAGHNPPIVFRRRNGSLEELMPTGIALGAVEQMHYFSEKIAVETGDIIVMYTDGITESVNTIGEDFGEDRLRMIICENAMHSSKEILTTILDAVSTFSSGLPQFDDITLMVIKKE